MSKTSIPTIAVSILMFLTTGAIANGLIVWKDVQVLKEQVADMRNDVKDLKTLFLNKERLASIQPIQEKLQ